MCRAKPQWQGVREEENFSHPKFQQALRTMEGCNLRASPHDLGIGGDVQQVALVEICEQQPCARIHDKVAEGIEKEISEEVRYGQRRRVINAHEPGLAAAMRHIHAICTVVAGARTRMCGGDEKRVGSDDNVVRRTTKHVCANRTASLAQSWHEFGRSSLNIFGAISETLAHVNIKPAVVHYRYDAIQAISPPRVRLDAKKSDTHSRRKRRAQRRSWIGQRVNRKLPRVRRGEKFRCACKYRRPRVPGSIKVPRDDEWQVTIELAVLIRHEVADHLMAEGGEAFAHANALLDRALALVKGFGAHPDNLAGDRMVEARPGGDVMEAGLIIVSTMR